MSVISSTPMIWIILEGYVFSFCLLRIYPALSTISVFGEHVMPDMNPPFHGEIFPPSLILVSSTELKQAFESIFGSDLRKMLQPKRLLVQV
jgi:hypothetical protein